MTGVGFAFVRKELRELSRDRKAIFLSFLLPVLLYPIMFSFTTFLERREVARSSESVYQVAVTGDSGLFRAAVEADERLALVAVADTSGLRRDIRTGDVDAWLDAPSGIAIAGGETPIVRLVYHGPHSKSSSARDRLRDVLRAVRREEGGRRWDALAAGAELSEFVTVEEIDVATATETGGARVGKMLPLLLIMTLFVGGISLSTDIVAGEKERGTLETLYLTPTSRAQIARSKFLVVTAATLLSGVLSVASVTFCFSQGWIGSATELGSATVSTTGIVASVLLMLPLAALIGGLLLGISAFARSVKEAQYYLTPVLLAAIVPGLFASSQDVRLDAFSALVPIANVALAIRDSLLGTASWGWVALAGAASIGWGWLAMRWTTGVLSREETILGFAPEPLFAKTRGGRRRATWLGIAFTVLGFFYIGQWMQHQNLAIGLSLSLWVLLPMFAAATIRFARFEGGVSDLLSLRGAPSAAIVGAVLMGVGIVIPMAVGFMSLQNLFLPVPEGLMGEAVTELEQMPTALLLFLIAFSPGVCEELVFRGAFLGLLRQTGTTRAAVIGSSVFFGLIHLSVFRFLPTFSLGLVMAALTVRTRSLIPSMVFHMTYNGITLLASNNLDPASPASPGLLVWAGSVVLLATGVWLTMMKGARV